jgi:hypothetical protein
MDNSFTTKKQTSRSFVVISSLAASALLLASMGSSVASFAVQPKVDLGLA